MKFSLFTWHSPSSEWFILGTCYSALLLCPINRRPHNKYWCYFNDVCNSVFVWTNGSTLLTGELFLLLWSAFLLQKTHFLIQRDMKNRQISNHLLCQCMCGYAVPCWKEVWKLLLKNVSQQSLMFGNRRSDKAKSKKAEGEIQLLVTTRLHQ